ncbi:MAG: cell surface protein, partial [Staphylococcus epidermidis]|nr:cell surface protein [Staphylococcus epidermidis]MDU5976343.1 cell surface protein [Staphylococcus epidermidis]MDU6618163.1 cell surface protein [Staphylococcus epidermidis]
EQGNTGQEGSNPNQSGQLGATVKPGSAPNQDTEATPNPDQTATGTQGATGDQNTQQGNTEQNNQNAEQGNTGGTDKDAKVNTNDDETKTDVKNDTELPETGLSNEYDYTTTVFGSIALISSLLLLRRQRKESK